jgi:hypothetical protein
MRRPGNPIGRPIIPDAAAGWPVNNFLDEGRKALDSKLKPAQINHKPDNNWLGEATDEP